MAVAVVVPKMGLKMESATLVRWLRAEGERVEAGEAVAEIETDKVTAQVTAPVSGLLTGLRAQPGDTLPVGAVLAYVGTGPEDRPEPSPPRSPPPLLPCRRWPVRGRPPPRRPRRPAA